MSALGELVLSGLSRLRRASGLDDAGASEEEGHRRYVRRQYARSHEYFSRFPDFDVAGKTVLEIGCGTGGRAAYIAARGAARVFGIDINAREIAFAQRLTAELLPEHGSTPTFLACSEDSPLDIGQFDVVLLADTMEHVVSPPKMMRLAHRYTAPGGRFIFSCIGYYHHAGSHLELAPFASLLFSDETMLNVTRTHVSRPDYVPGRFDSTPPIDRWRGVHDLRDRPGEHMNKITIAEIKKLVRSSPFRSSRVTVVGFGHKHPLLRPTDVLARIPLIQEVCHSVIVADCIK